MFKVSHRGLIVISGLIWLGIGLFLFLLGVNFLVASILKENLILLTRPILDRLAPMVGDFDSALIALLVFSLILGFTKCRFIFSKTVQKGVDRIISLPNPSALTQIYTKKYLILLGGMMLLGFIFRFAPLDVRGAVDVAIGTALMSGAFLYFKNAYYL